MTDPGRLPRIEPRGTLDLMILRALTFGPSHGYAIARWIERRTRGAFRIGDGIIYPALERLRVRGLLVARWRETSSGRDSRMCSITRRGLMYLASAEDEWERFVDAVASVPTCRPPAKAERR